jgi:mono/diheme cytochrome c family protein
MPVLRSPAAAGLLLFIGVLAADGFAQVPPPPPPPPTSAKSAPAPQAQPAVAAPQAPRPGAQLADPAARRGEYVASAAGCLGCHTEAKDNAVAYAGGRALKTPFGTFYGPNITPHPVAGIGKWSEADFARAIREGLRPDGAHYFPAFPYPSFARITDADLKDLWAYLRTLPPSARPNQAHDVGFPFNLRFLVRFWKWLYFTPGRFAPDPKRSAAVNRGDYLVNVLGHCGECHTPRNFLGGPKRARHLAGTPKGANEGGTSNLTPANLKKWNDADLAGFLQSGMSPDGDVTGERMGEVVRNTTSRLSAQDLASMIAYLRALPAIADEP